MKTVPFSYENNKLVDLIMNNENIIKKYYKIINKDFSLEEFNDEMIKFNNVSDEISKKFLENFMNKLKHKNNYLCYIWNRKYQHD